MWFFEGPRWDIPILEGPIVLKGNQSEHAIHSLDLANSRKQVLGEVCLIYDANICKVEGLQVA